MKASASKRLLVFRIDDDHQMAISEDVQAALFYTLPIFCIFLVLLALCICSQRRAHNSSSRHGVTRQREYTTFAPGGYTGDDYYVSPLPPAYTPRARARRNAPGVRSWLPCAGRAPRPPPRYEAFWDEEAHRYRFRPLVYNGPSNNTPPPDDDVRSSATHTASIVDDASSEDSFSTDTSILPRYTRTDPHNLPEYDNISLTEEEQFPQPSPAQPRNLWQFGAYCGPIP